MIIWAGRIKDSGTFIRVHNGVVTAGAPPLLLGLMTPVIFVVCVIVLVGLLFKRKPNNIDCTNCDNCRDCTDCTDCTNCMYCKRNWNCTNCTNCTDCHDCSGLTNETGLVGVHR